MTADRANETASRRRNRRRAESRARSRDPRARGLVATIPDDAATATATVAGAALVGGDEHIALAGVDAFEPVERSFPPGLEGALEDVPSRTGPLPAFAHASEAEMARILDFYRIRWEYEPHTFPILWNLDGVVVESFSPDFWLPDLDLYLELTTLRQKLVRKKNRKLRRIHELYPDIHVKLFYARDFRALMLKFGRLALIDELSGSSGQVVHDRAEAAAGDDRDADADLES